MSPAALVLAGDTVAAQRTIPRGSISAAVVMTTKITTTVMTVELARHLARSIGAAADPAYPELPRGQFFSVQRTAQTFANFY